MEESQTWRELLGKIIKDPLEKQRIAHELEISNVTLSRWVSGESNPRPHKLQALFAALPNEGKQLAALLASEFGDFSNTDDASMKSPETISEDFYVRVLHILATAPSSLQHWTITNIVIEQMLHHLDPSRQGMSIVLAQCMSPSGKGLQVRSLREAVEKSSPPWDNNRKNPLGFLGAESLGGYAVVINHLTNVQDLPAHQVLFTLSDIPHERSVLACPIQRANCVAGSLIISSTQAKHFTADRLKLVESYADLLSLAFHDQEFYPQERIDLQVMPSYEIQQPLLISFPSRVITSMIEAARVDQPITRLEAEEAAWQSLEDELLKIQPNGWYEDASVYR